MQPLELGLCQVSPTTDLTAPLFSDIATSAILEFLLGLEQAKCCLCLLQFWKVFRIACEEKIGGEESDILSAACLLKDGVCQQLFVD